MRADDEDVGAGVRVEERPPRALGVGDVFVEVRCPRRLGHLRGMVHEVAGDHCLLAAGVDAHTHVTGGVARRRNQGHVVGDRERRIDEVGLPGVEHRLHRVLEDLAVDRRRTRPVLGVDPRQVVASVRERRHPLAVAQHGVPADVVDVQVGAHDGVDRFGREPGRGQVGEKRTLEVREEGVDAGLVVAEAGIDDDAPARRFDDERLDAQPEVPGVVGEVRTQPVDAEHGVRHCSADQHGARESHRRRARPRS